MVRLSRAATDRNPPTSGGGGCQPFPCAEQMPHWYPPGMEQESGTRPEAPAMSAGISFPATSFRRLVSLKAPDTFGKCWP